MEQQQQQQLHCSELQQLGSQPLVPVEPVVLQPPLALGQQVELVLAEAASPAASGAEGRADTAAGALVAVGKEAAWGGLQGGQSGQEQMELKDKQIYIYICVCIVISYCQSLTG